MRKAINYRMAGAVNLLRVWKNHEK